MLVECYDKCVQEGVSGLGTAIYEYSRFFTSDNHIFDNKIQNTIKKYRYCKKFNCPPYLSLDITPIDTFDDFMIIDDEIEQSKSRKQNG